MGKAGLQSQPDWTGAVLVIASAIAFSAKAIFVKLAYDDSPGGIQPARRLFMAADSTSAQFACVRERFDAWCA